MAIDFKKLKQAAMSKDNLESLTKQIESMNNTKAVDPRIWKPQLNNNKENNTGYAVVRFLPNQHSESPFVKVMSYNFKGKNGYYNEQSLESINQEDPVNTSKILHFTKAKAEGNERLKGIAKSRQRTDKFYANVYIVKDRENPENEGKVKIFQFGYSLFKLIERSTNPEFECDTKFNPFDMWEGKDLIIKLTAKEIPDSKTGKLVTVPNYDLSQWANEITEFMKGDDEKKEEIYNQTYDVNEMLKLKTFDELATRFKEVTGEDYDYLKREQSVADKIDEKIKEAQEMKQKPSKVESAETKDAPADEDDIEAMLREMMGEE